MGLLDGVEGLINNNPVSSSVAAGIAGIAVGAAGGAIVTNALNKSSKSKKSRKKRKKITHTKRGWKMDRKRKSKQKWEVAYRRRKRKSKRKSSKRRSSKRIHYAKKTGQPYILLANGQAKFIKGKRKKR